MTMILAAVVLVTMLVGQPVAPSAVGSTSDPQLSPTLPSVASRVSRQYLSRLESTYGSDGALTLAGLERLLAVLGVGDHNHRADCPGHDGHRDGEHDHAEHAQHSGPDHAEHAQHSGPDHDEHAQHSGPDHDEHAQHSGPDHDDHAQHSGPDHDEHGQRGRDEHVDHDHSEHTGHDHGEHADYDHQQPVWVDHERGPAAQDGGRATLSSRTATPPLPAASYRQTSTVPPQVASHDSPLSAGVGGRSPSSCPAAGELLAEFGLSGSELAAGSLQLLCPALVYHASSGACARSAADGVRAHHPTGAAAAAAPAAQLWLFAGLSVLVISLCGLAGVAVVPIMQRLVYRQLLQFLVALAIGTLAGDALLHLLPHALTSHTARAADDHPTHSDHGDGELDVVLKGLVALISLMFFFTAERAIGILHGTCTRGRTKKINKRLADMTGLDRDKTEMIGKKISTYRHSTRANHCLADADTLDVLDRLNHSHDSCDEDKDSDPDAENHNLTTDCSGTLPTGGCSSSSADQHSHAGHSHQPQPDKRPDGQIAAAGAESTGRGARADDCEIFTAQERVAHSSDFTVIIHEHEHRHHGHTHTHGHIHQPPGSAAAVAGMVIVGDGLHNFTDGMAIGAAFAAGMASGFSTSVAVFCHELPHEIGDFAVLLKSGMSVRQALFYNVVSSVLCLFGMVVGMLLGNVESFSSWVFAAAAGSFIYIALVDMIPELTTDGGSTQSSPCGQLTLQLFGMSCGAGVMLTIAIYEHDLHSLISVV